MHTRLLAHRALLTLLVGPTIWYFVNDIPQNIVGWMRFFCMSFLCVITLLAIPATSSTSEDWKVRKWMVYSWVALSAAEIIRLMERNNEYHVHLDSLPLASVAAALGAYGIYRTSLRVDTPPTS